jgi:hypothetical protein
MLCFCLVSTAFAQRHFYMGAFGGVTNYKGDLGSNMLPSKPNAVGGFSMVGEINHRMLIRGEFNYGKVHGSDQFSKGNRSRNLDFHSKITELSLSFEYIAFDLYEYKVSPYVFVGVGTFKFTPYTIDQNGNTILLADLGTEGQGFYKGRKDYKLQKLCIPFGGGLQWALTPRTRLALELGVRKTNTDYLDDVSTTYVDQALLAQNKGGTSVRMAYRGDELNGGAPYPSDGTKRGNPDNKDWYLFSGLHFRISLQPKIRPYKFTYKSGKAKTKCPSLY